MLTQEEMIALVEEAFPREKTGRYPWRSFQEARAYVRTLGLKSSTEWNKYSKSGERPHDIPSNPHTVYRDDWNGWNDWLGGGNE
jgi:hypothetical protein